MKKIKIAQIITRLDWGGSPDIVRILSNLLNPDVYDCSFIFGATVHPSAKTQQFLKTFKGNCFVIPQLKRDINLFYDTIALIRLIELFRREKFDIVHTHTAKAGALGRLAANLTGVKVIIHTPHGHNFYGYFPRCMSKIIISIEKFLVCITDKIIALTELEKEDFMKFGVAKSGKLVVINQGLELDRYVDIHIDKEAVRKSFGIESDDLVVGMIGRLEPIKGPGYFIEAAKLIADKTVKAKFLIVGEGSLRKFLEKQVKSLGRSFIFAGWREDIPAIISILDILVLPSLNEAVGMILIEAQAEGIPVVASCVGGIPEVVQDKKTGFLVPSQDAKSLAEAISYLLEHKEEREKMGRAASGWVKGKFSAEVMVNKITGLYQELLTTKI